MKSIRIKINGRQKDFPVQPSELLLDTLRKAGYFGVKSGGCKTGECGACTILFDGKPVNSCQMLSVQADGHEITTVEHLGEHPRQGWKKSSGLNELQNAFIESGAIQCGYCTPAMLLEAKALLKKNSNPTEAEIRTVLSGVLCRCTGYDKPVKAIQAVAQRQTEKIIEQVMPQLFTVPETEKFRKVGKPEKKVDAVKLVQGKTAFTDDIHLENMLFAKVLHSPLAHARIKKIDATKARNLPGVAAVLTYQDIPRVVYSTAGQSDPLPGPLDSFSLDNKVRFVGDRVAFVAAESLEIAEEALKLIEVEYEPLPLVLDSSKAMDKGSPIIHDEKEYVQFADSDPKKNVAARIRIDIGDVEKGFKKADRIIECEYEVSKVQQCSIEPHVTISYWDEDDRLVIRTSTQVPFHARRQLAPVLGLPIKRIRVIKPRIGGGFGGKQEVLIEDVAAHLTIATKRPVRFEYTREEEFIAARSRHPMKVKLKTGVKKDGTITANEMIVLTDTGAYGCHALTVTGNTGQKSMALYVGDGEFRKAPNIRFYADIVYTNTPPAGAFRGYGVPQGFFPVERQMEKIARILGMDPIEFRKKNSLRPGELQPFSTSWSEGREPKPEIVHTIGLDKCVEAGKKAIDWEKKYGKPDWHSIKGKPYLKRGIGIANVMQGTAIPYLDMGSASIKMNEDGSFNLLIGATDLGTGSDTVLAQMAAEVLGVEVDDIIVYSSDTDFTPFDKGAYASSTTYISGTAVVKAANQVALQIKERAVAMWKSKDAKFAFPVEKIVLYDGKVHAPHGQTITLWEVGLNSLHHTDQAQIMAVGSYVSPAAPPPFASQFAQVLVDTETGQVTVEELVMAVDSGVIVNPITASGQIEGGMSQSLGYAVCEQMTYDAEGRPQETDFDQYHIFTADEMPKLKTIFVETYEPTHPFGIKAVAEIPLDGVAPAVANAILDACGAQMDSLPITPEKIWQALRAKA